MVSNFKLKLMPLEERPREKLKKHGPNTLSDRELIAILLRTGSKKEDVLATSGNLLEKFNLKQLSRAKLNVLQKTLGVGEAKACQLSACFELGRRVTKFKEKKIQVRKARDVADILLPEMKGLTKEHLKVVFLDSRKRMIKIENIFVGSLDESVIHPREIFQAALEESAAAILLVHNHPSGDPTPSSFDIKVTKQIIEAGEVLGINVLDHIVIGDGKYFSMAEKEII